MFYVQRTASKLHCRVGAADIGCRLVWCHQCILCLMAALLSVIFCQGGQDAHLQCRLQLVHDMLLLCSSLVSIACRSTAESRTLDSDYYKLKSNVCLPKCSPSPEERCGHASSIRKNARAAGGKDGCRHTPGVSERHLQLRWRQPETLQHALAGWMLPGGTGAPWRSSQQCCQEVAWAGRAGHLQLSGCLP